MDILDKAFIKGEDLMTRNIAGETLIVPVRKKVGDLSAIYTLNEVGAKVWEMIDGKTRGEEIVRAIRAEYEVSDTDAVLKDVTALLASMADAGLIHYATESAA